MSFFELFIFVILMLLFASIFSPFFGGCLVLSIILLFITGILIIFSANFIWIISIGLIIYIYTRINKFMQWVKLPDINKYLDLYPQCQLSVGVSCFKCNSVKLNNVGFFSKNSKWRFYVCAMCNTRLFRFKVL